jgi:hypothetical protein
MNRFKFFLSYRLFTSLVVCQSVAVQAIEGAVCRVRGAVV